MTKLPLSAGKTSWNGRTGSYCVSPCIRVASAQEAHMSQLKYRRRVRALLAATGALSLCGLLSGCIGIASVTSPMVAAEGRTNRSQFDMYRSEEGKPMFRYKFSLFSALDKEKQLAEARQWLEEWTTENNYCKKGWTIVSDRYEPWQHAFLDPIPIGGTAVKIGQCRPLESVLTHQ